MRPPVLLLLGLGSGVFIPLPVILLWPFVGLSWLLLLLGLALVPSGRPIGPWLAAGRNLFAVLGNLPGLRVDVRPKDGVRLNLWII